MANTLYHRTVTLLEADIGEELVALEPQGGNCFGFNGVATCVWRSLEQPKSFEQLRDELMRDYDVSAEQCVDELHELLDDMVAKGLIATGGNSRA